MKISMIAALAGALSLLGAAQPAAARTAASAEAPAPLSLWRLDPEAAQ